mmetsp:Transcript_73100/g.143384  ORF Transcript_73100/g.143384 Transcript_73100/m.143384 type:complete len:248 (+) Transcript_73100:85-828(+)|eukprot:CAMPEP_0170256122 /NCGR_PEP_ID=MMETSP0116_2-20130129/27914_1 /TAXON_ID=400756 /ORGANISM="Durinskia baltica, Strain CSIRO CS-38" /LENGTH=247 /DNA_ID=CAMNT_0010507131 /DNA_START=94 /DNA_END=837 /DNA_ORIENTATION=-
MPVQPTAIGVSADAPSVALLSVVRASDLAVLAQRAAKGVTPTDRRALEAAVSRLLDGARPTMVYPRWKASTALDTDQDALIEGVICALADARALSLAVAVVQGSRLPERTMHDMLNEVHRGFAEVATDQQVCEAKAGELSGSCKHILRSVMARYSDSAKVDKVTEVHAKVDEVKGIMHDNVRKILETHISLEMLQAKTDTMSDSAHQFLKQSTGLRRQVALRNLRVKIALTTCTLALGAYILMPFFD